MISRKTGVVYQEERWLVTCTLHRHRAVLFATMGGMLFNHKPLRENSYLSNLMELSVYEGYNYFEDGCDDHETIIVVAAEVTSKRSVP